MKSRFGADLEYGTKRHAQPLNYANWDVGRNLEANAYWKMVQ